MEMLRNWLAKEKVRFVLVLTTVATICYQVCPLFLVSDILCYFLRWWEAEVGSIEP